MSLLSPPTLPVDATTNRAVAYFNAALAAQHARRVADAERGYLQALAHDENYADAYHMLGILRHETGNSIDGVALIRRALTLREDALYLGNLGNILIEMGQMQEAEAVYRRALQLDPDAFRTHYNLAVLCAQTGRKAEAMACYRRAIITSPDFAEALDNLGIMLHEDAHYREAEKYYRRALAARPEFFEAYVNLGKLQSDDGRLAEAEQSYLQALHYNPSLAEVYNNLGGLFEESKRTSLVQAAYKNALILRPDYEHALSNLAHVLLDTDQAEVSERVFRRALAIRADSYEANNGLGSCLHGLRKLKEAEAVYRLAIAISPGVPAPYNNLANLLRETGRLDDADRLFRCSMETVEDKRDTVVNYAFLLLHRGDFESGWRYHEERLKQKEREQQRIGNAIPWQGDADLHGKTIMLSAEQGMGDTLQFVRYASQIAARGALVYLDVQPPLKSLIASCPGVAGVFAINESAPPFHYHASLMSLPHILKTRLDTIPAQVPYLFASPAKVVYWKKRLGPRTMPRVGLTWAGDPRKHIPGANAIDRQRSMHFEQMLPLLDVPGIAFYSLQLGEYTAHQLNAHPHVIDVTSHIVDFEDTAAIVENLDLVITVDTSVCHLVGAIGKPVWMLNRFNTCWRWMSERSDSPWYPTMRIFRQPAMGDWEGVIAQAQTALQQWRNQ